MFDDDAVAKGLPPFQLVSDMCCCYREGRGGLMAAATVHRPYWFRLLRVHNV